MKNLCDYPVSLGFDVEKVKTITAMAVTVNNKVYKLSANKVLAVVNKT